MNGNKSRKLRSLAKMTVKAEPKYNYERLYSTLKQQYKTELKTINQK